MALLRYIEIENFKTFGDSQRIELGHPLVIIGPNNCGKTTVIQAIALWSHAVKTYPCGPGEFDRAREDWNRVEPPEHRECSGATDALLLA